ncbi:MAG: hypothetical protein ABIU09_01955 [Pyrinomonadaceae bacterium]
MTRRIPFVPFPLLVFSLLGLWQFSQDVRTVNVVGLFGSGAIAGAILAVFIAFLKAKREP